MKHDPAASALQTQYLRHLAGRRRRILFLRILLLAAFLLLWEIAADTGRIDAFIFSSPSRLAVTMADMLAHQQLLRHIGYTLGETLLSFAVSTVLGTCVFRIVWIYTVFRAFPTLPTLYAAFPLSWILTALLCGAGFLILCPLKDTTRHGNTRKKSPHTDSLCRPYAGFAFTGVSPLVFTGSVPLLRARADRSYFSVRSPASRYCAAAPTWWAAICRRPRAGSATG